LFLDSLESRRLLAGGLTTLEMQVNLAPAVPAVPAAIARLDPSAALQIESASQFGTNGTTEPAVSLGPDRSLEITADAFGNKILVSQDDQNVNVDGDVYSFSNEPVSSLSINGLSGNDRIVNNTNLNATLNRGKGNDLLIGGLGSDVPNGGAGNDVLTDVGGTSNRLVDGSGNEPLWALSPDGQDVLLGGTGNDTL
jgi:Ca2+-binding RTX toxin-like protein